MWYLIGYLLFGFALGQLAAFLSAKAWGSTYKATAKEGWILYGLCSVLWPLAIDLWFNNNAAYKHK